LLCEDFNSELDRLIALGEAAHLHDPPGAPEPTRGECDEHSGDDEGDE